MSTAAEHEVRAFAKVAIMQAIAIAHAKHHAPHDHLGFCVAGANPAHTFGSAGDGEGIGHNGEARPAENSINTGKR